MGKSDTSQEKKSTSTKVKFDSTLPNHNRVLTSADFKRHGVEHAKIDVQSGEVIEVSPEAADFLVALGEFSHVEDDEEATPVEEPLTDASVNQQLQDQNPDVGSGASATGANTRDGAGARSATINR